MAKIKSDQLSHSHLNAKSSSLQNNDKMSIRRENVSTQHNRDKHKLISASKHNLKKISTVCVSKKINLVASAIYLPQTCGGSHNYSA